MMSAPMVRALAACCLLLSGCGGARSPERTTTTASLSPDAPSWARSGDEQTSDGSLFVCEGAGADEQAATEAARALCSAKVCELCGVEVKSTLETRETLERVDVERKVVETCRRVRTGQEEVRYRQAGCGPSGCVAWLQVFFSAEAEARECRAYADGNFADSAQCEALIEQFRSTKGLSAASFGTRVDLLGQAIVACADIDVRPTPKLTALDEILWQGVVSASAEPQPKRPIDKAQSIAERLRALSANTSDAWKRDYAQRAYGAMDRQPLLESKVYVERIALIRDAMMGYQTIMTALEAVVDAEHAPDAAHDAALVAALRGLRPVPGKWTAERVLAWAADELSRLRKALRLPGLKAYFMEMYAASGGSVGHALLQAMVSDERASEDEWKFAMTQMSGCVACPTALLDLPDHGGEATRLARLVEYARSATTDQQVDALSEVNPELLLRAEASLAPQLAAKVFRYAWFAQWLRKLPPAGRDTVAHTLRRPWTSKSYDWRWLVTPEQHRALAARAFQLLSAQLPGMRCADLDKELSLLERHGVDTRSVQPTLCRCVSEPQSNGMRDLTELYQRLVAWGASCVGREGT